MEGRTGRHVLFAQHTDRFIVENEKMNSYTGVNIGVRKMLDQSSKDATQDSNKHSLIW